jgi:galactokinase
MSIADRFAARFGGPSLVWQAPGRANLIGEHTDYNEGFVLPFAIDRGTEVAVGARDDGQMHLFSTAFPGEVVLALDALPTAPRGHWSDYIVGIVRELARIGLAPTGANLLIESDLPPGAGLSSSAALEVATAGALLDLRDASLAPAALARICHAAETGFVGTQCGIMDMLVSTTARAGCATWIDCRTQETRLIPLPEAWAMLVVDTGVRHDLAAGEYNNRRRECAEALAVLARRREGIGSLRDVGAADLKAGREDLGEVLHRRVRHIIEENGRVGRVMEALAAQDLPRLAGLFADSHRSLRDDYEVSCSELDHVVDIATQVEVGAAVRMMGGGFGGSVIALAPAKACQDGFGETVLAEYQSLFGEKGAVLPVRAAGCAGRVSARPQVSG